MPELPASNATQRPRHRTRKTVDPVSRRRPIAPNRRRLDPDRLVGLACVLLLPVALWLA